MPYTFGAAASNRITWAPGVNPSTVRAMFGFGWWYPTTLTAGRRFWSNGVGATSGGGVEIDTTTTQIRVREGHATTGAQWTTSDAGLAINKWAFIAWLWTPVNAGGAWRVWSGSVDTAPQELTVTNAVAAVGNYAGNTTFALCNSVSTSIALQGDGAEFGYLVADITSNHAPFYLNAPGTITQAEADLVYQRFVVPAWRGEWPVQHCLAGDGTGTALTDYERGHLMLNTSPVVHIGQSNDTTTSTTEPTITGAVPSQNGHPRGRSTQPLQLTRPRR